MKKKVFKSIVLAVTLIFSGSGIAMAGDAEMEQLKQQVQQLTRSMAELEQDKKAEEASEESEKKLSPLPRMFNIWLMIISIPAFFKVSTRSSA